MTKKIYIIPEEVKQITLSYEKDANISWYPEELPKQKYILWGLIPFGKTEYRRAGWGNNWRETDEQMLDEYNYIIFVEGERCLMLKPKVNIYFKDGCSDELYFDTNKKAETFANKLAKNTKCNFIIEK